MSYRSILITLALSLAIATPVSAQMGLGAATPKSTGMPGALRMMPVFADFDGDGDGRVSQSEFDQTRAQRIAERSQQGYQMRNLANAPSFADLDTNGDGVLDQEEFTAGVAAHHQPPVKP